MSATFKNSRRKLSQLEMRKFMNEHRSKEKELKKIESPLAKYNDQGQLTCVLCKSIVMSEAVWTVHVNARQHKQNIDLAKKFKKHTNNFTMPFKRPLTPPLPDAPEKKIKGILKNALPSEVNLDKANNNRLNNNISDDFCELTVKQNTTISNKTKQFEKVYMYTVPDSKEVLPEGFFDDPKLDAKARNQEYKDPIEEEWDKFVKAIKEADNESIVIIAEDQEESTTERQIDEIDEQMKNLSRVLDLERKKNETICISNESKNIDINKGEDDLEDENFDEFLDWRAKKSFK